MTFDAAIVTAVYDRYDAVKPVLPQVGIESVDWVLVTDEPIESEWSDAARALGWRVVSLPRPGVHPNLAAKRPKMLPWEFTDADRTIWIDASVRVVSERFAVEALEHAFPMAQFGHPSRDCIYQEQGESQRMEKYAGQNMLAQVEHYRERGHPASWGLWCTGIIARNHLIGSFFDFGKAWLAECERWTFQDQLSEAVVLREHGLRPLELPGAHWSNPWLVLEPSGRH